METQLAETSKVGAFRLEQRWGKKLIAAGWLGFPSVLLHRQQALGLDAIDLNILLQIALHWWGSSDELPFPSKRGLADRIGVKPRTVQRRVAQMEKDGLITREPRYHSSGGNKTNAYNFTGLIKEAEPYAQELLEERHQRKQEKSDREKRKGRPKLHVVKD